MVERGLRREVKEVEKYEYLLVEYLKEISNEITYLVMITCALFLFVIIDLIPGAVQSESYYVIKVIFILLIAGGFGLYGMSNITKRRIEKRFTRIFVKQ